MGIILIKGCDLCERNGKIWILVRSGYLWLGFSKGYDGWRNIFKQVKNDSKTEEYLKTKEFDDILQKYKNFFVELLSFYISGRYPSFKEKVSSSINSVRAKNVLDNTEEAFKWIESLSQYKK